MNTRSFLKEERKLELWAESRGTWVLVKTYDIQAASGGPGPKLVAGDKQVPEGVYRLEGLNPNSRFHLSLRVNYPNEFDRRQARADGRTKLGGDIYIHGKAVSAGCLAMGDAAIEELFVLASRVGIRNISIVIAPWDFRRRAPVTDATQPVWVEQLYGTVDKELRKYGR